MLALPSEYQSFRTCRHGCQIKKRIVMILIDSTINSTWQPAMTVARAATA